MKNSKIKMVGLLAVVVSSLLFSSCGIIVTGGGYVHPTDRVQSFVDLLNSRYAFDSHFYVVKRPEDTLSEGFVVVYSDDTGYVAYDIRSYSSGDSWNSYTNYAEYSPVYIHRTETDSITGEVFYFGDTYFNSYGRRYAGEFVFDKTVRKSKDLEKVGALREAYVQEKMGDLFVSKFGLSAPRATKVAKMVMNWQKLKKSRSVTAKDANNFSKELLGVNVKEAENTYRNYLKGDRKGLDSLIKKAAKANGVKNPENMRKLIEQALMSK